MISGVVFLDKPLGWTSRKAVNEVARLFREGREKVKAGHAGTLDPLATGMLPVFLGEATRFSSMGLDADKRYDVTYDLSLQTDTLDSEGEVAGHFEVSFSEESVREAVGAFVGEQMQTPPSYSAIRINGERAHARARAGESFELPARRITIHSIDFLAWEPPLLKLSVHCSKGTYIRSLGRDIGERLGAGGCVVSLRRSGIADWPADTMVDMEHLVKNPAGCVLPLSMWLRHIPALKLDEVNARRFVQGQRLRLEKSDTGLHTVFYANTLLGTGDVVDSVAHPKRILPSAQELLL